MCQSHYFMHSDQMETKRNLKPPQNHCLGVESKINLQDATCSDSSRFHQSWHCRGAIGDSTVVNTLGLTTMDHANYMKIDFGVEASVSKILLKQRLSKKPSKASFIDVTSMYPLFF